MKSKDRGTPDDLVIFGLPHVEVILHCVDVFGMCLDVLLSPVVGKGLSTFLTSSVACAPKQLKITLVTFLYN